MKLKIYILVLVSLFAISCKKKTYVTIQAKNLITGDGSGYANMPFSVVESWTPVFEKETKKVYSGTLNENGYASFELRMNKNRKYELSVKTPEDICYGKLHFYSLNHSKNNNIEFDYLPCGYFNPPRENVNCEGETDEFRFVYYYTQNPDIYIEGMLEGGLLIGIGHIIFKLDVHLILEILLILFPKEITHLNGKYADHQV